MNRLKKFAVYLCFIFIGLTLNSTVVQAAEFEFATGYYVARTGTTSISGLGFQPEFVMIKSASSAQNGVFKTSSMPANTTAFLSNTANNTGSSISFTSTGFNVNNLDNVGTNGQLYHWVAVRGSDCSSSGTFCVGSYVGDGNSARNITSVGFEPAMVIVKPNNAQVNWATASLPLNWGMFFDTAGTRSDGSLFQGFLSNGFAVGSGNNANGVTQYFVAFSKDSEKVIEGSYTGDGTDNRNITAPGVKPDFLMLRNAASATLNNRRVVFRVNTHFDDLSSYTGVTVAAASNLIQNFISTGFQVGSAGEVNENTREIYYFGLTGEEDLINISGKMQMKYGNYTGNGGTQTISGIGFDPSLVVSKVTSANNWTTFNLLTSGAGYGLYKGVFSNNITSGAFTLGSNSFSVGSSAVINSNTATYLWYAFGNAINPYNYTGNESFIVGAYRGNGINGRQINLPFQPDFVLTKGTGATSTFPSWRLRTMAANETAFFVATPVVNSGFILDINANGFVVGNNVSVNSASDVISFYAFRENPNFKFGTYTGDGSSSRVVAINPNFHPDLLWVQRRNTSGADRSGAFKTSNILTSFTPLFDNTSIASGGILGMGYNTFSVDDSVWTNENGLTYYWFAFNFKKYNQQNYRFFENDNSEVVGAPLAAQNTPYTTTILGERFRLRMIVDMTNGRLVEEGIQMKLQAAQKGSGSCSSPEFNYFDITNSSDIAFFNNGLVDDKVQLGSSANDPTSPNTLKLQDYVESNPFRNSYSEILDGESMMFDFSLFDNARIPNAVYCFRMVYADSDVPLDDYNQYPELTTSGLGGNFNINFSLSNDSIGFGKFNSNETRYATSNGLGSDEDTVDAITITTSSNAVNGYRISLIGSDLICQSCGATSSIISSVGSTPVAPIVGSSQFGLRAVVNDGNASVSSPFNSVDWAFESNSMAELASAFGDEVESEIGIRFMANIDELTAGGIYRADLQFIVTANF